MTFFCTRRVFVFCITSFLIIQIFTSFIDDDSGVISDHITIDTSCYHTQGTYLKLIADDKLKISVNRIFFLETSCKGGLDSRQACSVESAAKANSNWTIIVFFTGPIDSTYQEGKTLSALSSMSNIQFVRINVKEFTKNTLLEALFTQSILNSSYPVVHSSDMLRILVLNKYGGVYLDLDMIVMKSFNDLPKNFVIREFGANLAFGILAFTKDGVGGAISNLILRYLRTNFNPQAWATNGAGIISKIFVERCNTHMNTNGSSYNCDGVRFFDNRTFIPVPYVSWRKYYEDYDIEPSQAYTHHLWNAMGGRTKIPRNSLYSRLAQKYCPKIYGLYGDEFGN